MTVTPAAWIAVVVAIVVMLAVDLLAHRKAHVIGVREAAAWSAVWVGLGIGFGVLLAVVAGWDPATQYFSGYLIEKTLAVDNVAVFAVLFASFAVPREYQHRVLFYGVLGALVLRGIFIAAGAYALERFAGLLYVFGIILLVSAVLMLRRRGAHPDPSQNRIVRLVGRVLPTTTEYHGQRFWVRQAGRWVATPLFVVLVAVEITDVIFAVDSIPASFAVTQDPFLVFTSNAFAILGLRALYFLLADLMHRFVHLTTALAVVLALVGVKLLLHDVVKVPSWASFAAIAVVITIGVVTSLRSTRGAVAPPSESQPSDPQPSDNQPSDPQPSDPQPDQGPAEPALR
ncbi:MAG: TerC family protein [Kineosporiaceae bacterium]